MPAPLDPSHKKLKKSFGPRATNDPETIDRIKGLAIQPFIFDLCAVQDDIAAHLDYNEFREGTAYKRDHAAAVAFDRALDAAGYSNRGTPYWVDRTKGEPTISQIKAIAEAAERCLPMLNDRYMLLTQMTPGADVNGRKAIVALGDRMHKFDTTIGEFKEMVADAEAHRRKQTVTSSHHKCALD